MTIDVNEANVVPLFCTICHFAFCHFRFCVLNSIASYVVDVCFGVIVLECFELYAWCYCAGF